MKKENIDGEQKQFLWKTLADIGNHQDYKDSAEQNLIMKNDVWEVFAKDIILESFNEIKSIC